jgi:hypothetical protein
MKFHTYCKKFKDKLILVDCFNQKQVKGVLTKINPYFLVVRVGKNAYVTVNIDSVAFIQEYKEECPGNTPGWIREILEVGK